MPFSEITWQDVQQLADDGRRHEAIGGDLHVTPPPSVLHQTISGHLYRALYDLLEARGHGRVWTAPIGVEFPETREGVQPDLVFVSESRLSIVGEDGIRGAPDLVVEILSPSTRPRDRDIKRKLYLARGVAEYWVVDPEAEQVEVWRTGATSGASDPERHVDRLPVRVAGEPVGRIDLHGLFGEARQV
jgi:Uma2 family endonuclease